MSTVYSISTKFEEEIYWAPRALAMLGVLIVLIFSFDPLWPDYATSGLQHYAATHIVPALAITAMLLLAWRHEMLGALGFFALCLTFMIYFQGTNDELAFVFFGLPLLVIGVLFLIHFSID